MATIKFTQRELLCKIVYYGPGLGGKTTNLQYIFNKVPEKYRGNLTSVDTKGDRTLFFDLLPLDYGKFRGFSVRLQLYTVPGQVIYNASRRIVLKGADGVVFVADSQVGRMDENVSSIKNLRDNLHEYGIDWEKIPTVLQYNKRDLSPICSIEELNQALNFRRLKCFEATAVEGEGVFPTLKGITAVVVPTNSEGFSTGPPLPKMGHRASNTVMLRLDNVRVPKDHIIDLLHGAPFLHPIGNIQFLGAPLNIGVISLSVYPARPHPIRVT